MRPRNLSMSKSLLVTSSGPGSSSTTTRSPCIRFASSSSSSSSSGWARALPQGVNPAYDTALNFLSLQQSQALSALERLRAIRDPSPAILKRIDKLEVKAYVNDPAIRKTFRESRGRGMMDQPVMRHLAERRWQKDGGLDLIMGRIYQNKVVPDLVPDLGPTSPLSINLSADLVEPGSIIEPSSVASPPTVTFQPFAHPSQPITSDPNPTGLYTLLVIDPDTPSPETQSFTQRLHFLKSDIPLSILSGETNLFSDIGSTLVSWEPPAPEEGSGKHRYVFVLLHQTSPSQSPSTTLQREKFNFHAFMKEHDYPNTSIVGINFIRAAWTKEESRFIDSVWKDYRGVAGGAMSYGRPLKAERYGPPPRGGLGRKATETRQSSVVKGLEESEGEVAEEEGDRNIII